MKKILLLLLLVPFVVQAQSDTVVYKGKIVRYAGAFVVGSSTYSAQPPSCGSPPFTDNFESYTTSSDLDGQGFWADESTYGVYLYDISSNTKITSNQTGAYASTYYNCAINSNQYSQFDYDYVAGGSGVSGIGVSVRNQDETGDYYAVIGLYSTATSTSSPELVRVINNTRTILDGTLTAWSDNDEIRLEVYNYDLRVYINDVLDTNCGTSGVYTDTHADKLTGGYAGVAAYGPRVNTYGDSWEAGVSSDPTSEPVLGHPMVDHTQVYVVSSECQNNDELGYVHYLCTDSIFNDRSSGSYSFSIISGNGSGYCAVGSSTGMLTVNSATAITTNASDITLGVEVSHGTAKDTATCYIYYRTGVIHVDLDKTASGTGTRSNPYPGTYNYGGSRTGGTILFKRGTDVVGSTHQLEEHDDEYFIYGAYGTGAKPVFLYNSDASNAYPIYLGSSTYEADSVIIMDLKFYCGHSTYETIGIYIEQDSDHNKLYRINTVGNGNNAAIMTRADFTGADAVTYNEFYDIQGDSTTTHRVIKSEAGGGILRNIFGTYNNGRFIYTTLTGGDQPVAAGASIKYVYTKGLGASASGYALDVRAAYTSYEWCCIRDWNYAIAIYDYDYYGYPYPTPQHISFKNILIETTSGSAVFSEIIHTTFDDPPQATFENVVIYDAGNYGMSFSGNNDRLTMKNCIVVNSTSYGVYVDSDTDTLDIINCILLDNGTYDAYIAGPSYDTVMNTIWDNYSSDAAVITNYDYGTSGDPFVDETNRDYRSDTGEGTINTGTAWYLTDEDILRHVIGTVDIGPFEYPSTTNFNWTKR